MEQQTNTAEEINRLHFEICGFARKSLEQAIRIGELLTEQKSRLNHGEWLPWVKGNLAFSDDTARRYVTLYRRKDEIPHNAEFQLTDAYRLLSASGEPEEAEPAPLPVASPKPTVTECGTCGEMFDPDKWDAKASGFSCPYCWRDATAQPKPIERPAVVSAPHVSFNAGDNEWYTPREYVTAALSVMGQIDLDPASSEIANKTVDAKRFFTKETNGLEKKWSGCVWMNPPYAQPLVSQFCEKVSSEYESGHISQACVLVNNATETTWFQRMMQSASAVSFPKGRIKFIDPEGNPGAPLQGQAIIYFGKNKKAFVAAFQQFGFVL